MKIYLAQLNPTVGDLKGNVEKLCQVIRENAQADLIVFPELFLTGYPPKDLLLKETFLYKLRENLLDIQEATRDYPQTAIAVGLPWPVDGHLYNSVAVIKDGVILGFQHKRKLIQLRLFDENLYFTPGLTSNPIRLGTEVLGLAVGLELDAQLAQELKDVGATLIINPVAVPFTVGEGFEKCSYLQNIGENIGLPILRAGQVGANDELIFSGGSCALNSDGKTMTSVLDFHCGGTLVNLASPELEEVVKQEKDQTALIYEALILGLRDYVLKSGMSKVIIGLSGGLDSAVVAVLATEALGPENVWGITQPGPYSMSSSVKDAQTLADNLEIKLDVIPITSLYEAVLTSLEEQFVGTAMNVAEENIQARLRGNLLMALSNKFGGLVLTNSNKSELAVGYCTLYGDMSGGLAVIADVYKTMVYQLAYYINREREIIPWNTIEKPPSAELRPDQRDDETLPPYDILDGIISAYFDQGLSPEEIIAAGYARKTVQWVTRTIDNNDYKRRQAALILRATSPIIGRDRQMPLAAKKQF